MRKFLSIGFIISLTINAILIFRVFDLGVTTTYQSDEVKHEAVQLSDMSKMLSLLLPKVSRSELLDKAQKAGLTVFEKKEENTIYVGEIGFLMDGGFVKSVKYSSLPSE